MTDPTLPMREKACTYPEVDEGTSCTQTSFKTGGKAFLYVGEQGGRFKAMFKLRNLKSQAKELAQSRPDDFQIGKGDWVTARFSEDTPLEAEVWQTWLDESYGLSRKS